MSDTLEKRRYPRYSHSAALTFSHLHSWSRFPDALHHGEKLGHGAGGLQFKSAHALKPGAVLLIKIDQPEMSGLSEGACGGVRSATVGQVKWCRPLGSGKGYMVGIQYFNVY